MLRRSRKLSTPRREFPFPGMMMCNASTVARLGGEVRLVHQGRSRVGLQADPGADPPPPSPLHARHRVVPKARRHPKQGNVQRLGSLSRCLLRLGDEPVVAGSAVGRAIPPARDRLAAHPSRPQNFGALWRERVQLQPLRALVHRFQAPRAKNLARHCTMPVASCALMSGCSAEPSQDYPRKPHRQGVGVPTRRWI